jgi:hypothetical protein
MTDETDETDEQDETAGTAHTDDASGEAGATGATDAKELQQRLDDLGAEIEDAKRAADELARDSGLLSDTDAATYYETISGDRGDEDEEIAPG